MKYTTKCQIDKQATKNQNDEKKLIESAEKKVFFETKSDIKSI